MEFQKTVTGFNILVNNKVVGSIYRDDTRNYMFQIVAKLNFEIRGYRNEVAAKTWKQVKKDIEKAYNNLIVISEQYGKKMEPVK